MNLEILNTIQWVVLWSILFVLFFVVKSKLKKKDINYLKNRYFFLSFLVLTLLTHTQFYTLNENQDIKAATKQFTYSSSNKTMEKYLEENKGKVIKRSEEDREKELSIQKAKSEKLIKQIEEKHKEKQK